MVDSYLYCNDGIRTTTTELVTEKLVNVLLPI